MNLKTTIEKQNLPDLDEQRIMDKVHLTNESISKKKALQDTKFDPNSYFDLNSASFRFDQDVRNKVAKEIEERTKNVSYKYHFNRI